jgi:predicted CDP-diglyceride synthetase/phosphatidate cytidylyltransferase
MAELRNSLWLWGQDAGSHHSVGFGLPGKNLMGSAGGMIDIIIISKKLHWRYLTC